MTRRQSPRHQAGLSMVELMVSLTLGLIVLGGALTVFVSNKATYAVTEGMARVQESSRMAFELMARDLREAGGTPCERDLPIVNVLNNPTSNWWSQFNAPVTGYNGSAAFPGAAFGTGVGERVNGTQGFEIKSAISSGVTVAEHQPDSASIKVNTVNHGLNDGDIVMVCDFAQAAVFQVTNASPGTNVNLVHNTGTGSPGNATKCLDLDGDCPNGPVKTYTFGCFQGQSQSNACVDPRRWPAQIAKLQAWRWYIGNNAAGGRSLYRTGLRNSSGTLSASPIEVAENVTEMEVTYLVDGATSYVPAASVAAWATVTSARVRLTITSGSRLGTDGQPLARSMTHTVALRNRTQ